jgi:AmmeMemoRadiSam system protein A
MTAVVNGEPLPPIAINSYPAVLQELGASFVTLTQHGELRGCIGAIEPYLPLIEDVREHAIAAATQDYRFSPVRPGELTSIKIEISVLTPPQILLYDNPEDLMRLIKPDIDGVIMRDGSHRATFLPQVWTKLPNPDDFLNHLCQKMGAAPLLWRYKKMNIFTYQVEEFHE